jgi:hypothetical protein
MELAETHLGGGSGGSGGVVVVWKSRCVVEGRKKKWKRKIPAGYL